MAVRRSELRIPLAVAFFIALSGACGGGDDGTPAEYETKPGPSVPQPPAERRLDVEGEVTITPSSGEPFTISVISKVEGTTTIYNGRESGYDLVMACGDTVADVDITLYLAQTRGGIEIIERKGDRWTIGPDRRAAEIVPSQPTSSGIDAGGEGGSDGGDGGDAGDASVEAPPSETQLVDGVSLPATDGSREISVTLLSSRVRYDIRATIPWRASNAPASCQEVKPGTGTSGSGGGCGGGGSSRRSSGGDWD